MAVSSSSKLTMKYLNLPKAIGGRGGVERFFLLSHNIPFEENLVSFSEWGEEKERLMKSGENPCGNVPLLYYENGTSGSNVLPLSQHIATCRYLAKVHGVSSDGASYQEYVQDLLADEYQGFRNAWAGAAFGGDREEYSSNVLPVQLAKFEALYKRFRTHDVFLSVSKATGQPLWGDAAMFGLLRDHIVTGFVTEKGLEEYPALLGMFRAYKAIPAVADWCAKKEKEVEE